MSERFLRILGWGCPPDSPLVQQPGMCVATLVDTAACTHVTCVGSPILLEYPEFLESLWKSMEQMFGEPLKPRRRLREARWFAYAMLPLQFGPRPMSVEWAEIGSIEAAETVEEVRQIIRDASWRESFEAQLQMFDGSSLTAAADREVGTMLERFDQHMSQIEDEELPKVPTPQPIWTLGRDLIGVWNG